MQAQRDEQAVGHAVKEQTDIARGKGPIPKRANHAGNGGPKEIGRCRQEQARRSRYNRHKTPPAEEGQIRGQGDRFVFIVEQPGRYAYDNAAQHAHVNRGVQHFQGRYQNDIAYIRGQGRRAVVFFGKADGHAQGKDDGQVAKDRLPGCRHKGDVKQVRLPQAQQQPGNRQDGNGQHEGFAQFNQTPSQRSEEGFKFVHGFSRVN